MQDTSINFEQLHSSLVFAIANVEEKNPANARVYADTRNFFLYQAWPKPRRRAASMVLRLLFRTILAVTDLFVDVPNGRSQYFLREIEVFDLALATIYKIRGVKRRRGYAGGVGKGTYLRGYFLP